MKYSQKYISMYNKAQSKHDADDRGIIRIGRFMISSDMISEKYKRKNINVLDYGAADGIFCEFLKENQTYYYIDIAKQKIKIRANDKQLRFTKDWKIPLKDKTMDVVFMSEVIEHLPNIAETLDEIKRVLKDDGLFIITTPNAFYTIFLIKSLFRFNVDPTKQHINLFDYSILQNNLEAAGFRMKKNEQFCFFYPLYATIRQFDNLLAKIFRNNCMQMVCSFEKIK